MCAKKQQGFTLIELMISLAIFSVLIGLGAPSFISAMKNSRLDSDYGELVRSMYLARSEAVKRTVRVGVCARATDTTCGANWNNGWIVFLDNVQGTPTTTGVINNGDEILRFSPPLDDKRKVTAAGSPWQVVSSSSNSVTQTFVQYRPDGSSSLSGGTFVICDDRGEEHARTLNIVLTGDIRKGRKKGNKIAKDVYGVEIVCPTV